MKSEDLPPFQRKSAAISTAILILSGIFASFCPHEARCASPLPYPARTTPYSGYGTTVRGDIRTVGMAGATTGLADTFLAAADNPAGLAMTMNQGDINFASNQVFDAAIQDFDSPIVSNSIGAALVIYPWALSLGYLSSYREDDTYLLPSGSAARLNVNLNEFRAAAARVFFDNRLSLGLSLNLAQSEQGVESDSPSTSNAHHSYALGATLGAMYRLPRRLLIGLGFKTPIHVPPASEGETSPLIAGLYQGVFVPWVGSLGTGWIPNRFFRTDFTLRVVGTTPSARLLRDQRVAVGQNTTFQPHLGAAYVFADFHEFSGTFFLGSYYEHSRIAHSPSRYHGTIGIETKPWVFTTGFAFDLSQHYRNYILSIGVDVFRVFEKVDLIPKIWRAPQAGWFPKPFIFSDEGLSRPMVAEWKPQGPDMDPIKIGLDIPKRLKEKIIEIGGGGSSQELEPAPEPVKKQGKGKNSRARKLPPQRR